MMVTVYEYPLRVIKGVNEKVNKPVNRLVNRGATHGALPPSPFFPRTLGGLQLLGFLEKTRVGP